MNPIRGEVVLVLWPFASGAGAKVRPALVEQNDLDNRRLTNTIVAMITSVTKRSLEPTQLLIEKDTPAWIQSGLRLDSVVNCANFFTIAKDKIIQTVGSLPTAEMTQIDDCLRLALALK